LHGIDNLYRPGIIDQERKKREPIMACGFEADDGLSFIERIKG